MNETRNAFACIIVLCSILLTGCTDIAKTEKSMDPLQQKPEDLLNGISRALCYSEYRSGQHPDLGKGAVYPSEAEILEDLQILTRNSNFGLIRIYNSGESSERVLKVIRENNIKIKVMLGAWLGAEANNPQGCDWVDKPIPQDYLDMVIGWNKKEIQNTIRLANEYKDIVIAVNIGNEVLGSCDHMVPIDSVIAYLRQVRKAIEQPVTVADYFTAWFGNNEKLAKEVDFITVHVYPVWEGKDIDEGMSFTIEALRAVKKVFPKTRIVIGEIGWASIGSEFGQRASEKKQKRFYNEIMEFAAEKNITIFFFEAFDEDWKGNTADINYDPNGAERHWGIFSIDRKPKLVVNYLYPDIVPEKQK